MDVFSCPAKYRRHVLASLALALAEVRKAELFRADEDARVRALSPVPENLIDHHETGDLFLIVAIPNDDVSTPAELLAAACTPALT